MQFDAAQVEALVARCVMLTSFNVSNMGAEAYFQPSICFTNCFGYHRKTSCLDYAAASDGMLPRLGPKGREIQHRINGLQLNARHVRPG